MKTAKTKCERGTEMEPSNLLVVCLGMGTVFFGLICLVAICKITSAVCKLFEREEIPVKSADISNKQELIAAISAVIAEENGTEANNIKIMSFKKI